MPFYYTPYIILPLMSALINGGLAVYARQRRHVPAAGWFFWLMVGLSGWSLSYALNTAATGLWMKNLLFKLGGTFVCIELLAIFPMIIVLMGGTGRLSRIRSGFFAIVPVISCLMLWTNDLHGLMRYGLHLVSTNGMLLLGYIDGPYYRNFHIAYHYVLYLAAILTCLWGIFLRSQPRRFSLAMIVVAVLIPLLTDMLDLAPVTELRLTTSSLFLSGLCFWLAVFRHKMLELVPVARETLFEQMREPVLIMDMQGRLAGTNDAARSLLGIPADASGLPLESLLPHDRSLHRLASAEHGETLHDKLSGCWWHISRTLARHDNVGLGWILVLRDVTELHRAQERLAEALASEHEARNEQDRFLDMISHEYRTPLAIIQANIDLLEMKEAANRDVQYGSLGKMQRAVERLVDIFESARRRKSLDPRRLDMEFEFVAIGECLGETIGAARDFWGDRFVFVGEPPDCFLLADRHLLRTAVLNLLDNAIKYSPPGEPVNLHFSRCDDTLILEIHNRSARPLFSDTSALFRKYSRGTNSAGTSGTGVGLYLAGSIVEQHNGSLTFAVNEQYEVTVKITLPLGTPVENADDI